VAWIYLVVFGSLIAFSAYRYVVERVSPTLAATYAYVNPPVALFVGWWLGGESFSANVLLGLPIVLIAVALLAWIQTRSPASTQSAASAVPRVPPPMPSGPHHPPAPVEQRPGERRTCPVSGACVVPHERRRSGGA